MLTFLPQTQGGLSKYELIKHLEFVRKIADSREERGLVRMSAF